MDKLRNTVRTIWKTDSQIFLAGLITGLLAYMYVMTNKLYNWDEIYFSFTKGYSLVMGRWGLDVLDLFLPSYSMPWLWGLISIGCVVWAAWLVIHIFGITSRTMQIVLTALMVSFPSIISVFSYMFMSVAYTLSLLLTVVAFYLTQIKCAFTGKTVQKWGGAPVYCYMYFDFCKQYLSSICIPIRSTLRDMGDQGTARWRRNH